MLPLNKIFGEVKKFVAKDEIDKLKIIQNSKLIEENEIAIFANDMTNKHKSHVDVKLIKSLIIAYADSLSKSLQKGGVDDKH